MKCPLCKTPSLDATVLAPDLEGRICGECNGVWIARAKYDAWAAIKGKAKNAAMQDYVDLIESLK